jgi:uncharacterized membrane protein (DUF4010 family)
MTLPTGAFERLLVSLLVGFLIGLDRERAEVRKHHQVFAGIRTFPLIALAGAVPMLIVDTVGVALVVASFVAVAAITVVSYLRGSAAGDVGATTEMAALATFLLGALAGAGQLVVAGAAGVAVGVLLVAKPRLQAFSRALTAEEVSAALELAVISVIVLPLLPNGGYGPWQALNPFNIWLVVVLVTALSFAGFVAVRVWGERQGLAIAAGVGALVSSTAVTIAMATRSRARKDLAGVTAAAAVLASVVMCIRVAVLTGSIGPGILPRLLPVVGVMAIEGAIAAWLLGRKAAVTDSGPSGADIRNPFSLTAALTFGAIYAVVLLLVEGARIYFGARGIYLAAALAAIADVDAVSIACVRLGTVEAAWRMPAAAVTVAVVTNTLVKLAIALVAGAGRFKGYVVAALGIMAAVGAAVGVLIFLRF